MKVALAIVMCSLVYAECMPPYEIPELYRRHYECMIAGYEKSLSKMKEIGRTDINKDQVFIKFACYPVEEPGSDT